MARVNDNYLYQEDLEGLVSEGVSKEDAEEGKKKLEEAGASVRLVEGASLEGQYLRTLRRAQAGVNADVEPMRA